MKKIIRKVYILLKGLGYARTAAMYARAGKRDKAVALMQEYEKCK